MRHRPLFNVLELQTRYVAVLAVCAVLPTSLFAESALQPVVSKKVAEILESMCYRCHGLTTRESNLNLSTSDAIAKGGDSGLVVVPGKPEDSPLYVMVRDGEMPPKDEGTLSKDQIQVIRNWILEGAGADFSRRLTHDDVNPILLLRCTACHGAQKREANLDLRSLATILKGGKSGRHSFPANPTRVSSSRESHPVKCHPVENW